MTSEDNRETVRCSKCRTVLDEPPSLPYGKRTPCPMCSSLSRYCERSGHITRDYRIATDVALSISISETQAKAKRHGKGRPFIEYRAKHDLYGKTSQDTDEVRIIDRENNLYKKTIRDSKTGEVIYECCEPLDKHTGHGYAKHKGETTTD
jgi:hypothetical protein